MAAVVTLAIAAVVFWSAARTHRQRELSVAAVDQSQPAALLSPVEGYVQFAATARDSQSDLSDDQMVEGLRKLAGALGTLSLGGPELLVDLRVGAEHILLNPASTETTSMIRDALIAAADAMERGIEADVVLREAAESIRPDRPLIEQQVAVLHFFRQAADAFQRRAAADASSVGRQGLGTNVGPEPQTPGQTRVWQNQKAGRVNNLHFSA